MENEVKKNNSELIEEEGVKKTEKLQMKAVRLHSSYAGKIQIMSKCSIHSLDDFAVYYTPGVAGPCKIIEKEKEKAYELTNKWNTVAVISDGTRVLGLGDIGPEAGLPVMEGKALLFKYLGGVDAIPICLDTKNAEEIIQAVKWLQPSFGGINLEDIANPKCFQILDTLREEMEIPVWHDDQQGTAAVTLTGLTNALKIVGKKLEDARIAFIGAGAANVAISRVLFSAGVKPRNCIVADSKGILHPGRKDIEERKDEYRDKWRLCQITNPEGITGGMDIALKDVDVCLALSKPGPGVIKPEWVNTMNEAAIVFACANPVPEIWPQEAKEAGAEIVATGRSDFANQVNNSIGFPGIFRGALDVRAKTITDEMCIAAANALALFAQKRGINEDYIIPTMEDSEAFVEEAVAVGLQAQKDGVARLNISSKELYHKAESIISNAQKSTSLLMKEKLIPSY
ncbi:MAG: NADP-dependent malic enzyme [Euryarchaeota archaeon]|nr:NADP-dependent malic enzyme [Euryarchaeota archaeon]